ncbi:hypothetical protein LZ554_002258 [Drepanopeziza brunnea f. sp. 'monogermtubi']|nr:hypothetical protein LZ554_002258 [Drepanopeziza brunnea f. sp. 'monogermtubi']
MEPLMNYINTQNVKQLLVTNPEAATLVGKLYYVPVGGIEVEGRIKHQKDGSTSPYTVLSFCLEDIKFLPSHLSAQELRDRYASTGLLAEQDQAGRTRVFSTGNAVPPPRDDQRSNSKELEKFKKELEDKASVALQAKIEKYKSDELEIFKRELEAKGNEALQEQVRKHQQNLAELVVKCRGRLWSMVDKSLTTVAAHNGETISGSKPTCNLYLGPKAVTKLLSKSPEIFQEYQDICEKSLIKYQADLKRQYRKHIEDVEFECRDWLKQNVRAGLSITVLDGLRTTIARAKDFQGDIPRVTKDVGDMITSDMLHAEKEEMAKNVEAAAAKDLEENMASYLPEKIQLNVQQLESSVDDGVPESRAQSEMVEEQIFVGVPAALLPLCKTLPAQVAPAPSASATQHTLLSKGSDPATTTSIPGPENPALDSPSMEDVLVSNKPQSHQPAPPDPNGLHPSPAATAPYAQNTCNKLVWSDGATRNFTPISRSNNADGPSRSLRAIYPLSAISTLTNITTEKDRNKAIASMNWTAQVHRFKAAATTRPFTPTLNCNRITNIGDLRAAFDKSSPTDPDSFSDQIIDIPGLGVVGEHIIGKPGQRKTAVEGQGNHGATFTAAACPSGQNSVAGSGNPSQSQTEANGFGGQGTHIPESNASTQNPADALLASSSGQTKTASFSLPLPHSASAAPKKSTDPNIYQDESLYDAPSPSPRPRPGNAASTLAPRNDLAGQPCPPSPRLKAGPDSPPYEPAPAAELLRTRESDSAPAAAPGPHGYHLLKQAQQKLQGADKSQELDKHSKPHKPEPSGAISISSDCDLGDEDHAISISSSGDEQDDEEDDEDDEYQDDRGEGVRREEVLSVRQQEVFMQRFKGQTVTEIMAVLEREEAEKEAEKEKRERPPFTVGRERAGDDGVAPESRQVQGADVKMEGVEMYTSGTQADTTTPTSQAKFSVMGWRWR